MDNESFRDEIDDLALALEELETYENDLAEEESYEPNYNHNRENDLDDFSDLEPDLYEDLDDELEDIDF